MPQLRAAQRYRDLAWTICTLVSALCFMAAGLGALPALSRFVAPASQLPQEELETHSDMRLASPRSARQATIPETSATAAESLSAPQVSRCCWSRQPRPLVPICLIGSGIRMLC